MDTSDTNADYSSPEKLDTTKTTQSRRSRRHWKRIDKIKEEEANAAASILSCTWEGQVTKPVDALNAPYNNVLTSITKNNCTSDAPSQANDVHALNTAYDNVTTTDNLTNDDKPDKMNDQSETAGMCIIA